MDNEEGQNAYAITFRQFYIVSHATNYENHPK